MYYKFNYTVKTPFFQLLPTHKIVVVNDNIVEVVLLRDKDKKEINITVGQNIRFYREKAGLNREKLSELIGVSPRFLADCELGFVGISLTTLKKICEVLGVSADNILWNNQNQPTTLQDMIAHIDPKYHPYLEKIITTQLEMISLLLNKKL